MTASETSSRSFDAVLCDLDNVIRFYDMTLLAELERDASLAEGTTARVAYAPDIDLPLLLGKITKEEWVCSIASALHGQVPQTRARELAMALADAPFRADAAVVALLRRVRKHMPLVLVTNATLELERDLESMGLADLADHVVSSARVGVAKPDGEIYEIAAERAGVAVNRCLFVDDQLENVKASITLGMTGVHYQEPADLQKVLGFVLEAEKPPKGYGDRDGGRAALIETPDDTGQRAVLVAPGVKESPGTHTGYKTASNVGRQRPMT